MISGFWIKKRRGLQAARRPKDKKKRTSRISQDAVNREHKDEQVRRQESASSVEVARIISVPWIASAYLRSRTSLYNSPERRRATLQTCCNPLRCTTCFSHAVRRNGDVQPKCARECQPCRSSSCCFIISFVSLTAAVTVGSCRWRLLQHRRTPRRCRCALGR